MRSTFGLEAPSQLLSGIEADGREFGDRLGAGVGLAGFRKVGPSALVPRQQARRGGRSVLALHPEELEQWVCTGIDGCADLRRGIKLPLYAEALRTVRHQSLDVPSAFANVRTESVEIERLLTMLLWPPQMNTEPYRTRMASVTGTGGGGATATPPPFSSPGVWLAETEMTNSAAAGGRGCSVTVKYPSASQPPFAVSVVLAPVTVAVIFVPGLQRPPTVG